MQENTVAMHVQSLGVVGAPSSAGARRPGQEQAPRVLRDAGLLDRLKQDGLIQVRDFGNLPMIRFEPDLEHPHCQNLPLASAAARQLADRVASILETWDRFFVVGGDCSLTLGLLAGAKRHLPHLGLLYFDGDIDMNTPADTPSGILDGMVLAHVTGRAVNGLGQLDRTSPRIPDERIVAFGYNADAGWIDRGEMERFHRSDIHKIAKDQIRGRARSAAEEALSRICNAASSFVLHFDVDVLTESEFPAADVPHANGITLSEAATALHLFWTAPQCVGMILTEFNPELDPSGTSAARLVDLIGTALRLEPPPQA